MKVVLDESGFGVKVVLDESGFGVKVVLDENFWDEKRHFHPNLDESVPNQEDKKEHKFNQHHHWRRIDQRVQLCYRDTVDVQRHEDRSANHRTLDASSGISLAQRRGLGRARRIRHEISWVTAIKYTGKTQRFSIVPGKDNPADVGTICVRLHNKLSQSNLKKRCRCVPPVFHILILHGTSLLFVGLYISSPCLVRFVDPKCHAICWLL